MATEPTTSLVAVIMGSKSDWDTMRHAVETLDELGVPKARIYGLGIKAKGRSP